MDPASSIGLFLLKGTFDLMTMILRKQTLEKLREGGDVSDLRKSILTEIDKVSFKLETQSRTVFQTSIFIYKQGLEYLNEVLNDQTIGKKGTEITQITKLPDPIGKLAFYAEKTDRPTELKCPTGADLTESSRKENLRKTNQYFKSASKEAMKACNDGNLKVIERLEAMYIFIMATILQSVENPGSGIVIECRSCLAEMQKIKEIKDVFERVIIKRKTLKQADIEIFVGVCHLYRVFHEVTQFSHQYSAPWTWPCINIEGKKMSPHKIDPLRDVRVAEVLCRLQKKKGETVQTSVADLPVVWSFGSADDGKLISPRCITTNPEGQFIIIDDGDRTIKVFDETGTFMKFDSFRPLCSHLADEDILSVVTDREDNLYVLIKIDKYRYEVHVFKKHAQFSRKFSQSKGLVRCSPIRKGTREEHFFKKHVQFSHKFRLSEGIVRCTPIINDNNQVLVVIEQKDQNVSTVEVYKSNGECVKSFGKEILKEAKDMTIANEGRLMVLDGLRRIVVFDADGNHMPELDFDHEGVPPEAVAFHSQTKHFVVSNLEPGIRVKMSIYNEHRDCVHSIYQGEERNVTEETECVPPKMTVTKDGRIAILAGIVGESKVIVV